MHATGTAGGYDYYALQGRAASRTKGNIIPYLVVVSRADTRYMVICTINRNRGRRKIVRKNDEIVVEIPGGVCYHEMVKCPNGRIHPEGKNTPYNKGKFKEENNK